MSATLEDFRRFMEQREVAARAYMEGDAAPLAELVAERLPASFFPPGGGRVEGAPEVAERYMTDARAFGGGETHFEILHLAANGDIAWWVGLQHAKVKIGDGPARAMSLRITELFRHENGGWKLVHRHADALADEPSSTT
ncbi:nuclear transport factor 2 family protein [Niveibacterium sp. SC-1]|uniref:YybH family protein n=1 Tax=Niveibacterium sp. SC-1 TaxID=3135646 RepID=UPI0031203615